MYANLEFTIVDTNVRLLGFSGDYYAPWLGRPVEVDRNHIETLIENEKYDTTWKIANILKISKSIKLLVKMQKKSVFLWIRTHRLFGQTNGHPLNEGIILQ